MSKDQRRPLVYEWLWLLLGEVVTMVLGVALFVCLGWNPYIGAAVAAGLYVNVATLVVGLEGRK